MIYQLPPILIFFIGTVIAMLPYLFWYFNGNNPYYHYEISIIPSIVWIVGLVSFYIGTIIRSRITDKVLKANEFQLSGAKVISITISVTIAIILLLFYQSNLHGGIPLLNYLDQDDSIDDLNDRQEKSVYGILGAFTTLLFFCNGIAYILIVWAKNGSWAYLRIIVLTLFILLITFGNIFCGKRQGLFIETIFLILSFSSLRSGETTMNFKQWIMRLSTLRNFVLILIVGYAIIYTFGILGSIRQGRSFSSSTGIEMIGNYLDLPLINMEHQCEVAGYGPGADLIWGPFKSMIPYKTLTEFFNLNAKFPPRLEPGIGAGFWGDIHWYWGMLGIILSGIGFGVITQYLYQSRNRNIGFRSAYYASYWPLLAANSYNHLISTVFFILPVLMMISILPLCQLSYGEKQSNQIK